MPFGQQNSSYDLGREKQFYDLIENKFCCRLCPFKKYSHLRTLRAHFRQDHPVEVYGPARDENVPEVGGMEGVDMDTDMDDPADFNEVAAEEEPDVILSGDAMEGDPEEDARNALRLLMDRHGWSYRSVNDILRLYRLHPDISKFRTVHDILDIKRLPKITSCKVCSAFHDVTEGETCDNECPGGRLAEVMYTDLEGQIKRLANSEKLAFYSRKNYRKDGYISDGVDGSNYRHVVLKLAERYPGRKAISLSCCVPMVCRYMKAITNPIFLVCEQIEPGSRFRKRNVILAGLWHGSSKPPARAMMRIVQKQIDAINSDENFCILQGVDKIQCCVAVTKVTADTPAKALLTSQKLFNGKFGCTHCEVPGENFRTEKGGNIRSYASAVLAPGRRRTHKRLQRFALLAEETNKSIYGIKNIPPLIEFPYLDRGKGIVVDEMHGAFLGIAKQTVTKWMKLMSANQKSVLLKRLEEIKFPPECNRPPKHLELALWKASTLREWVCNCSIVCCEGLLPQEMLESWAAFVEAFLLLSSREIHPISHIGRARILINQFLSSFEDLYGKSAFGINVHCLSHWVDGVEETGPLWANSMFGLESLNGSITRHNNSNHSILQSATVQYVASQEAHRYVRSGLMSTKYQDFCTEISSLRKGPKIRSSGWSLKGIGKLATEDQLRFLPVICRGHNVKVFSHGTLDGSQVWTSAYKKPKRNESGCHFFAVHKESRRERFVVIDSLFHCSACKMCFTKSKELKSFAYKCGDITSANCYIVEAFKDDVIMRCSDYNWLSAYSIKVESQTIFSVIRAIKLSD